MTTLHQSLATRGRKYILTAALAAVLVAVPFSATARADRLYLADGKVMDVDAAWEDEQGVWYRRGSITQLVERALVRKIERDAPAAATTASAPRAAQASDEVKTTAAPARHPTIYFVSGARVEADEVSETDDGVWFRRENVSAFAERASVERIEREPTAEVEGRSPSRAARRGWTTGGTRLDSLIRENGSRHGVDPYLIFLVMEHESHFNTRAVSPKGARGLMQLMPATARRFGVRNPHDPAQNVSAGTRYLKELLDMFSGRVDLALAGYNAGEGAVMRYGSRVPPYRETREYVRRIGASYGGETAPPPRER